MIRYMLLSLLGVSGEYIVHLSDGRYGRKRYHKVYEITDSLEGVWERVHPSGAFAKLIEIQIALNVEEQAYRDLIRDIARD